MKPITLFTLFAISLYSQLIDRTKAPNPINEGIAKSLTEQIGAGRGDWNTVGSSSFIINRDPFRAIRRGRQLFQRKFQHVDGAENTFYSRDGSGAIEKNLGIGAGLADSCASCHGRPRGSAGFGGDVVTRPDSRDAPHLFGLGLKEMLADEITAELRTRRAEALTAAKHANAPITAEMTAKGIDYGLLVARPDGTVDSSRLNGIDTDLRVRPFFAHGGTISIREFIVGALNNEMGFQAIDRELDNAATAGSRFITQGGMLLNGLSDSLERPPDPDPSKVPPGQPAKNLIDTAIVDYLEFYLLNYFKPGLHEQTTGVLRGRQTFDQVGCASCHIADLQVDRDRRVADVETVYDAARGNFNHLFSTATPLFNIVDGGKVPKLQPFLVKNIFTDFKRHDLGPNFWERNYDGSYQKLFLTTALWGVGSTSPYGHDGRSANLNEVILWHGGEAQSARDRYAALGEAARNDLQEFLRSLVIFPPDDTASNLDPGDRNTEGFPQKGHGSIKLTVLFNNPADPE